MGLEDRDYMQPGYSGRRPPGFWVRLRFALWLLVHRRGSRVGPRRRASDSDSEQRTSERI